MEQQVLLNKEGHHTPGLKGNWEGLTDDTQYVYTACGKVVDCKENP